MQRLMMSMVLMTALSCGAVELPSPIAWWKMDQIVEGKVPDASGNGRDLTVGEDCVLSNSVSAVGDPIQTLYFPGTLKSLASFACPALRSRTVVINVWRESGNGPLDPSVNAIPYLLSGLSSLNIEMRRDGGDMRPWLSGYDGCASIYPLGTFASRTRQAWRQLAVVVEVTGEDADGAPTGDMRVYVDAALTASATGVAFPKSLEHQATCFIGNNSSDGKRPLFGHLGETRVYDSALTAAQIQELRMSGLRGKLMVRWNMDRIVTDENGVRSVEGEGVRKSRLLVGPSVSVENDLDGGVLKFDPVDAQSLADSWSYADVPCDMPAVTVSLWYNISSTLGSTWSLGNNIPKILSMNNNTRLMINDSGAVTTRTNSNLDYFLLGDTVTRRFAGAYLERDHWAHIAITSWITYDEGGNRIGCFDVYVNGQKFGETTSGAVSYDSFLPTSASTVLLGCGAKGGGTDNIRVIKGSVDDVRIYAGRLSEEEIQQVWRGPATVNAGADFAVASGMATLRGSIGTSAELPLRQGFAGEVEWTLVSAPAGGEGATIEQSKSAVTRVTLPVAGEYEFQLACTAMGVANTSRVTVTRVAASTGNQPPTVTLAESVTFPFQGLNALAATVADPDAGPGTLRASWKKISGPGGVWFAPADAASTEVSFSATGEYVLRCTADDGQDTASADITVTVTGDVGFDPSSLTNGLFAYYPFTNGSGESAVAGGATATFSSFNKNPYSQHFEPALDGLGYRGYGYDNGAILGEGALQEENGELCPYMSCYYPKDRWRVVSAWVYHDAAYAVEHPDAEISWYPSIVRQRSAVDLIYLTKPDEDDPSKDNETRGFWIFQALSAGGNKYAMPAKDPANRWMHVCVVFDRWCEYYAAKDDSELWIDGVKQTPSVRGHGRGRVTANSLTIGGGGVYSSDKNCSDGHWTNAVGRTMSRAFPGIIDEVRFYNRKLTDEEIRYLATHPVANEHLAPSVTVPEKVETMSRQTTVIEATAFGDGIAFDSALTYEWLVLSGDESRLEFADKTARSTTLTAKKGSYVIQLKVFDGERTSYSDPIALDVEGSGMVFLLR